MPIKLMCVPVLTCSTCKRKTASSYLSIFGLWKARREIDLKNSKKTCENGYQGDVPRTGEKTWALVFFQSFRHSFFFCHGWTRARELITRQLDVYTKEPITGVLFQVGVVVVI